MSSVPRQSCFPIEQMHCSALPAMAAYSFTISTIRIRKSMLRHFGVKFGMKATVSRFTPGSRLLQISTLNQSSPSHRLHLAHSRPLVMRCCLPFLLLYWAQFTPRTLCILKCVPGLNLVLRSWLLCQLSYLDSLGAFGWHQSLKKTSVVCWGSF